MVKISQRKLDYRARLERYLREYKNILVTNVDMVGSNQMQKVRLALRGRAEIIMGKNTIMRKVIREMLDENPTFEPLLECIEGNVGLIFTNEDIAGIRNEIIEHKVPAGARVGLLAPTDVFIPAGPTGLDPGQTSFFQALNIATKIVKGAIEIITTVHLIKAGTRVSPSAVSLLQKMDVRPFFFRMNVQHVYESGSVYSAAVFDITEADLMSKFLKGVNMLASISLAIGTPNQATLPHSFARAFKKILALAIEADIDFEQAKPYKDFLADPSAFIAAAPAEEKKDAAPAAAAAAESDSEDDEEDGFGLFD